MLGLNEALDQLAVAGSMRLAVDPSSGYCGGHVLMRLDVDVGLE